MMFSEIFQLAVNNALRARGRLMITASGVVIGTAAVILLIALTLGLQSSAEVGIGGDNSLTEILVFPQYGGDENRANLTGEDVERIGRMDGVAAAVPVLRLRRNALVEAGGLQATAAVTGIPVEGAVYLGLEALAGDLAAFAVDTVLVGQEMPTKFVEEDADSFVPQTVDLATTAAKFVILGADGGRNEALEYPLVQAALFQSPEGVYDTQVMMSLEQVARINALLDEVEYDPDSLVYEQIYIRTASRNDTVTVSRELEERGYLIDSLGDYLDELNSFFTIMRIVLGAVGGMALLIAAFSVTNTMMVATLERSSEIGLLKAIGARDRDVLLLFLFESGLVGFVGGVFGVVLALILRDVINETVATAPALSGGPLSFLFDPAQLNNDLILIPPDLLLFAVIIATGVGLLAGLIPAWQVARMDPVIALKRE